MQICTINPPECKQQQQQRQSVIEERSKIKINHDDCCNCCCCCATPQRTCYKYVQPEVPKSFAPIRHYWKSGIPMDNNTTYRLSYWECPSAPVDPILPRNWLVTGDGEISDDTTYKNSYFEHCVKPESPCIPCEKQWLGRGPIQDVTTQKHDYTWKSIRQIEPYKAENNLYCAPAPLLDDTTYKLSYYQPGCNLPALSYAPIRKYVKPDIPMEDHTTYKLSYWPNESMKEEPLWQKKEYSPPVEPMDGCTTYKLSYWPHSEKRRSPIVLQPTDNILNAGCCTEDNTTYRLSYFGCGGDKRTPIRQPNNIQFSPCSLSYDTIHRMSFLGNWCVKQDPPIIPCDKQFLGRGPIQEVTTQKHDYTWKNIPLEPDARRADNLVPACTPIECCTTYRLSYLENDLKSLTPIHNYAPVRTCCLPDVPMEAETVMQLSYQPVECADKVEKPWSERPPYQLPVTLYYAFLMDPLTIFMSSTGLSFLSVSTNPILFTIVIPEWILPKIVCFPSSHCVGANVIKNCDPLVFGPELAMETTPAPSSTTISPIVVSNATNGGCQCLSGIPDIFVRAILAYIMIFHIAFILPLGVIVGRLFR